MRIKLTYPLPGIVQWMILIGVVSERWFELIVLLAVNLLIFQNKCSLLLSRGLFLTSGLILIFSVVNIKILGYTYDKFLQQFVVLLVYAIGYYNFFKYVNRDITAFFKKYLKFIYFISILGLFQFIVYAVTHVNVFGFIYNLGTEGTVGGFIRISSVLREPSQLSAILTPAVGFILLGSGDGIFKDVYSLKQKVVVFSTAVLTFSALMFFIIILMLSFKYLFYKKNVFIKLGLIMTFFVLIVFLSFLGVNDSSTSSATDESAFSEIIMKVDDSYKALNNLDPEIFETLNLSSYATMSNLWVAMNAPQRLTGTGLGTHEQNYYSTYKSDYKYYGLNAQEGYSLTNRLFSEFGFIGLCLVLALIVFNFNKNNIVNIAISFFILYQLIRGGHYVRYGIIMYFYIYYYTGRFYLKSLNKKCV